MRRLIQQVKHLNVLRRLLGWSTLEQAVASKLKLQVFGEPVSGKVLVLAPHPGDDVFALGGTLAKHIDQGDDVRVVYLCDGRTGSKRRITEIVQEELRKTRRAEAEAAAELIGIPKDNLTFWGYRDGSLVANKTTTKAMMQMVLDFVPRVIYAPHPAENDHDHETTALVLAKTLKAIGGDLPAEIWSYELRQPTFANRILDIGAVAKQKEAAIAAHASQTKYRSLAETVLGLNAYRGGMNGLNDPAEAFLALRADLYVTLWEYLKDLQG